MHETQVLIIGAGAAGLFCAGVAAQQGLKVTLLDHSAKLAEKIRISGGGRSNFTNRDLDVRSPQRCFLGDNPIFCRSALSRYTPAHFIELVQSHGIAFHEKHKGQLFCDHSSEDLIKMLLQECNSGAMGGSVDLWQSCSLKQLGHQAADGGHYWAQTSRGNLKAQAVVVATGGLSIPQIGATDLGYQIARQFGLRLVTPRPALVPLTFESQSWLPFSALAGLSLPVNVATGEKKNRIEFDEDLLFTHRGLSGPAMLQISSYWQPDKPLSINLLPHLDLAEKLIAAKTGAKKLLPNMLSQWLPSRLAQAWTQQQAQLQKNLADIPNQTLQQLANSLHAWQINPAGTEGYRKAEVTAGGVDTRDLSQQTMESRQPGLYFIGEVVDITGWLGGYNFQWAWSSAFACAKALAASPIKRL